MIRLGGPGLFGQKLTQHPLLLSEVMKMEGQVKLHPWCAEALGRENAARHSLWPLLTKGSEVPRR